MTPELEEFFAHLQHLCTEFEVSICGEDDGDGWFHEVRFTRDPKVHEFGNTSGNTYGYVSFDRHGGLVGTEGEEHSYLPDGGVS